MVWGHCYLVLVNCPMLKPTRLQNDLYVIYRNIYKGYPSIQSLAELVARSHCKVLFEVGLFDLGSTQKVSFSKAVLC